MQVRSRRQSGQSIVVIAVFSLVLFMFVGLGIDSGMLYLERRQLQNAVDAACLAAATELGLGGTPTTATAKGQEYFASNINASAQVAFNMTYPVVGSTILPAVTGQGANLSNGIEVDTQNVRVASTVGASTYFLRLGGIPQYGVRARAHCGATAGGGLLPIAVVRFPAYDIKSDRLYGANTTVALPQKYGNGKKQYTMEVRDALRTQSQGILNNGPVTISAPYTSCTSTGGGQWYNWALNGGLGDPTSNPRRGPYYDSELLGCAATVAAPGYPLELAGNGASASVGSTSFRGPIALDVRQIGVSGGPVYYNNWDQLTSTNAKKDRTIDYIKTQYPGPPVAVSEQVGLLSGVNAGNIIDAVQDRYPVGSRVITVVYNGHVFQLGDFKLAIACTVAADNPGCDPASENGERYVERPAPPTNLVSRDGTKCVYDAQYYIADGSQPGFTKPVADGNVTGTFRPAKYTVQLSPISGSSANTVKLTARLSGLNVGSSSHAGGPEDFGGFKVRWTWTDISGPHQTAYLYPDDPAATPSVVLPASGSLSVTLEVIQTAFDTSAANSVTCTGGPGPNDPAELPTRVAGAQAIQVIATESVSGRQHVTYGLLGMNANATGSNKFAAVDYFMSYLNEPVGKVISNDPQTLLVPLQLIRADDPSNNPNDDDIDQGDMAGSTLASSVTWYKDGTRLAAGTEPANLHAQLATPASSGGSAGKEPLLQIDLQSGGVVTGTYDIDLQINGASAGRKTHSARYRLVVQSDTNPSIDEYIVALCYSEFELLGADGDPNRAYKANELWGRATSGCKDDSSLKKSLTSRLLPW